MKLVHLTSSRFFGGPERQMLELARSLAPDHATSFLSFAEDGLCHAFLDRVRTEGFEAVALEHDTPHLWRALRELTGLLRMIEADVVFCHGYKANLLGRLAASRVRVPAIAVSRGWTGESFRVRLYERLDRLVLRGMDKVVCVSAGQAAKVRQTGVPEDKIVVIRNAVRVERFAHRDPDYRDRLEALFPTRPKFVVGAAGRLSPEKGFDVLIDAAAEVVSELPQVGFVVFGDGVLRQGLESRISSRKLASNFVLVGFRGDLDQYLPCFDVMAIPSHTEGLPNVALEAFAAGVPVVATAVGGNVEVVEDGISGYLVPPAEARALARRIVDMLSDPAALHGMGGHGYSRVRQDFSFGAQAASYRDVVAAATGQTAAQRCCG